MSQRYRYLTFLSGFLTLVAFIALRNLLPAPFVNLRETVFDDFQALSPRAETQVPVTVVDIDDASLERIGQWPWSRDIVARLIARLHGMGAASVVLDMLMSEPDGSSPARLLRSWQKQALFDLPLDPDEAPDFDRDLAETMTEARVVTGFGLTTRVGDRAPDIKAAFAIIGPDPVGSLFDFPGAVTNLPALEDAAAGNGTFSVVGRAGGIVRKIPLLAAWRGELVPSLALEALRVAQGQDTIAIRTDLKTSGDLQARPAMLLRVGAFEVPLDAAGEYWLHFRASDRDRMVPAWTLLADPAAAPDPAVVQRIRGHIVLIGTSAVGLSDLRATPVNPFEPGVNLHAQALEQILTGHHLLRPPWAPAVELALAVTLSILVLALAATTRLAVAGIAFLISLAGLAAGSFHLFSVQRLLVDPVTPAIGMAAVLAVATLLRVVLAERDRRKLRNAFAHYLSPDMVRSISEHPERLRLGGETRMMTFLFTDLEGFTSFTERTEPADLVQVMNSYLSEVCGIVMRHGGTIDKIVGDAVHVMFNAPLDQPDHADRAVSCAVEIAAATTAFAAAQQQQGRRIGITRIGVNTGPAVVGNFGGAGRFDYTAHGDAINTAARLEAANKRLGTRICVAGSTVEACRDFGFRPIATLMLKGKSVGIATFEPVPEETERTGSYRRAFADIESGGPEAGAAMLAHAERFPDDPLGRLHAARIAEGEAGTVIVIG